MDSGQRVVAGRYRLLAPLGSGGMGTVWRADDLVLGRAVAVKEVTFPHGLSDAERSVLRERTRREARAAARLDHPSAVTVYDVAEDGDAPYLVMELVEAPTLAEVVRDSGPLSPQRTAQVGLDLLGALEAAHAKGIVHRDVKPSNVMVREDGRVVLTDFGIATTTGDSSLTHTGLLLGSPAYISPERARGEPPQPASDLWSLGATLFTAVEGKPPFDGGEPLLTVSAVVTGDHQPFVSAGPLGPVIDGLLTKDPADRLDLAGARRALQRVADRTPVGVTSTMPMGSPAADPAAPASSTVALDLAEVARTAAPVRPPLRRPPPVAPAPRPDRSGSGGRRAALAAAGVAVLAAGAVALALADDDEPRDRVAAPATSTAGSPTPGSEPAPSSEPTAATPPVQQPEPSPTVPAAEEPAAPGVPAGWSTDTGGDGWTVALPPGYEQTRAGEYVQAATGRTLRVDTGPANPPAVADREAQAADFARRHPTYEQIRIEAADYRGYEAADWEFTYEGLHVLNRVFVVGETGHSLFLQTPEDDVEGARADLLGIAAAFRPAGT